MNSYEVATQVAEINDMFPLGTPWKVAYTDSNNNEVTLITSEQVSKFLTYKYGCFICSNLYSKFLFYNSMHIADLIKAFEAWNADYNPLDNYSGETERIHTRDDGDETKTHTTGGNGGTHNKVTNQALSGTYTQHDTTTYDSETFRGESKDSQFGGTETIDDLHTEDKTTHGTVSKTIDSTSYSGDEINHEIEKKHGNLGVTTSQEMITSEIDMRLNPLAVRYLELFVAEFCSYVGGAWRWYN